MVPATDPADAVTAPLVGYESSSGDEGPLVGDQPFARYKDSALGSRTESEPGFSICSDDDATGNCCALIPAAVTRSALAESTSPADLTHVTYASCSAVQANHTAQCTLDPPSLPEPLASLNDTAFQVWSCIASSTNPLPVTHLLARTWVWKGTLTDPTGQQMKCLHMNCRGTGTQQHQSQGTFPCWCLLSRQSQDLQTQRVQSLLL